MPKKRFSAEQIVVLLRQIEVLMSQGKTAPIACREAGISQQSYYRWRKEYGGLKTEQVKRLKELETENARLRKAISDLTLDKLILQEAASGKLLLYSGRMMQAPFFKIHNVRDHPARLLLLSEVNTWLPHDGIRRSGWSHLSRAVVGTPHEFPRSHPIPSSSRDASSICGGSRTCGSPRSGCGRSPAEVRIIPPHTVKDDREFTRDRNYCLLHSTPAGNRDAPRLERVPAAWPR